MRTLILLSTILVLGCSSSDSSQPAESPATNAPSEAPTASPTTPSVSSSGDTPAGAAGGITWNAPSPFTSRPPSSRMRAAEYTVNGDESALMTVFFFGPGQGGSVQANVDRWVGQMQQPDGRNSQDVAEINTRSVRGINVTIVDVSGTYNASMMGAPSTPQENQRMLGAIAEGPQGPIFFRLVGPSATIASVVDAFDGLVESFAPAEAPPAS